MALLRLFAAAREAAGTDRMVVTGSTVGEILEQATARFGHTFAAVLQQSRVWLNGQEARPHDPVSEQDEIAILPPVSGGASR